MNILTIVLILSLSGMRPPTLFQERAIVETPIPSLHANYLRYEDEVVVRIRGWLSLGHAGVFVSDAQERMIKLRNSDEVPSISSRATKNALYEEFWKLANGRINVSDTVKIRVVFEGSVRILKQDGKPATSFDVFGQFPVELIPLRIIEIVKE